MIFASGDAPRRNGRNSPIDDAVSTAAFTSDETSLSLVWDENLGSGSFTESTAVRPFAQVVAGDARRLDLRALPVEALRRRRDVAVEGARQRRAESG
jgi:hypothetical protein